MACDHFDRPTSGDPFSAGVVHDLGNLIQIAASAVNIIGRNPHARREAMFEPTVARAKLALQQAGALVRQTVRPPSAPTLILRQNAEPQDVRACLEEISGLIAWVCLPDITLSMDVGPDTPKATCNPIELQNAVLNLVINARDALPGGGAIRVASCGATTPSGSVLELSVADDGVGMSRETLAAAFTPYFSTKAEGHGAGLGLPMVHRFAREAGGRVDIQSAPGAGTTVTIRLPASRSPFNGESHA